MRVRPARSRDSPKEDLSAADTVKAAPRENKLLRDVKPLMDSIPYAESNHREKAVSRLSALRGSDITLNELTEELSSAPFILLAEDNPADVFLLERALNKHLLDFKLRVFADGEKAVRFIDAVDADESAAPPALILADLNLPKKGGLELLQFVRKSRRSRRVPFLILTSSDSPVDRTETAKFGATGYFCKPSSLAEFMEIGRVIKEALAGEPA